MCNAPKIGELEERTGYGGGFNERQNVEYIQREDSDDEFDDFGRRKKKSKANVSYSCMDDVELNIFRTFCTMKLFFRKLAKVQNSELVNQHYKNTINNTIKYTCLKYTSVDVLLTSLPVAFLCWKRVFFSSLLEEIQR